MLEGSLGNRHRLTPPRTAPEQVSNRPLIVLRQTFGTATLPTGTSEPSTRGEGGSWTVFGTATLPTDVSVASWRGEGDIYRPFGTGTLNRSTSGAGSRGKTVWNRCQTGLLPMLRPDFGTTSPARGLSVASWRGEAVIYWLFVHKMPLFHGH